MFVLSKYLPDTTFNLYLTLYDLWPQSRSPSTPPTWPWTTSMLWAIAFLVFLTHLEAEIEVDPKIQSCSACRQKSIATNFFPIGLSVRFLAFLTHLEAEIEVDPKIQSCSIWHEKSIATNFFPIGPSVRFLEIFINKNFELQKILLNTKVDHGHSRDFWKNESNQYLA